MSIKQTVSLSGSEKRTAVTLSSPPTSNFVSPILLQNTSLPLVCYINTKPTMSAIYTSSQQCHLRYSDGPEVLRWLRSREASRSPKTNGRMISGRVCTC